MFARVRDKRVCVFILLLVIFGSSACATSRRVELARKVESPALAVWEKLLETLSRRRIPLVKADRISGEIESDQFALNDYLCERPEQILPCKLRYFIRVKSTAANETLIRMRYKQECQLDNASWREVQCANQAFNLIDRIILDVKTFSQRDAGNIRKRYY